MKITNEEVERLMRVVADSLRQRWEKVFTRGTSLIQIRRDREATLAEIDRNSKKSNRILICMFVLGALFVAILALPARIGDGVYFIRGLVFTPIFVCQCWQWYLDRRILVLRQCVSDLDDIFSRLGLSVDSLNCLGQGNPYWDIIAEPQVTERLVRAAYRILDAQANFESCRLRPDAVRYDVIHAGNWIEHCEGKFDQIWNTATHDFELVLDKGEIFKQAARELANRAVVPTAI